MRYLLQMLAMASDLVVLAVIGTVVCCSPFNFLTFIIVVLIIANWHKTGGLEAWTKRGRNQFLLNAKDLGL